MKNKEVLQHIINGVEIEILNYKCDYVGIKITKANGFYYLKDELYITYEGGSTGKSLNDCKLILRPLSDLSNGKFKDLVFPREDFTKDNLEANRDLSVSMIQIQGLTGQTVTYFGTVQKLFKLHFDVSNLIEQGLAVNINTIK